MFIFIYIFALYIAYIETGSDGDIYTSVPEGASERGKMSRRDFNSHNSPGPGTL